VSGTPLVLGPAERDALKRLRERAALQPVDMRGLLRRLEDPVNKAAHMRQMTDQTVELAFGSAVTFSIENNHPLGACRHMSMSSPAPGRVPRPEAVWMVAEQLGFVGALEMCVVWPEELRGHGMAINVVQPLMTSEGRQQ
jgi:hypothetical protein